MANKELMKKLSKLLKEEGEDIGTINKIKDKLPKFLASETGIHEFNNLKFTVKENRGEIEIHSNTITSDFGVFAAIIKSAQIDGSAWYSERDKKYVLDFHINCKYRVGGAPYEYDLYDRHGNRLRMIYDPSDGSMINK